MAKLSYRDWLLNTGDVIVLKGKCKNPFGKIRGKVKDILLKTLEIDTPKFLPQYIGYDQNDGSFKGRWHARLPGDNWTKTIFEIICWGQQDLKTQEGWFVIKIGGYLTTSYNYSHSLQKSLWWTYSFFFYNKVRTTILEESRDKLFEIEDKFRVVLGIPSRRDPNVKVYAE